MSALPDLAKTKTLPLPSSASRPSIRSVESVDLLQGDRELLIRHGASTYRLRVTNSEKLILTK